MPSFDINSLLNFRPAQYLCKKCLALLQDLPHPFEDDLTCPVCKVEYEPTSAFEHWQLYKYLEEWGFAIELPDIINHSRGLALIAKRFREHKEDYPPLRALLQALNCSQRFVHFTTYGISHVFIGALKLVAQRIAVRGIVSNVDANMLTELSDFNNEAPNFAVKTYGTEVSWAGMPHQKLIIIDGLVAFKGSGNLTVSAWRKAAKDRDIIEAVTDVDEVINLHNRYFSPIWAELSGIGGKIEMVHDLPF